MSTNTVALTNTLLSKSTPTVRIITQTDYIYSTIFAPNEPTLSEQIPSVDNDEWEHHMRSFFPVVLAFAIIGVLVVIGCLIYLAYRFCQASRTTDPGDTEFNFDDEHKKTIISPISATLSHIIPWLAIPSPKPKDNTLFHPYQQEPIRFDKSDMRHVTSHRSSITSSTTRRPSLAPSWLTKILPNKFGTHAYPRPSRHMSLPIIFSNNDSPIDNLNIPISSTFVPIDKSSLTLVPRSEIWLDPHRRRGVDELEMWEKRHHSTTGTEVQTIVAPEPQQPLMWRFPSQNAYPDSPESFGRRFSLPLNYMDQDMSPRSSATVHDIGPSYATRAQVKKKKIRANDD
ncbi:uncharacterized protein B0P05DRAFT_69408 [Gilbertella persicaria]|uniref:uncharacterized protein n=1 Tax=Gilbertella persicaria TaxID=101096 RepID=UPI00221EED41|nr:uncharacterized protein B0P05DRAFT_69408 [Gilbertella persicaria]KAI8080671.1 hypothetical protein B0P05DRAFT_69408 [Gilbertella persicaria]